jgi:hypothetical protein
MEQPQMNAQELIDTARTLVAGDKGLLAMDESNPTCNKRFARLGIPQTEEARRTWRELIVTTPGLGECMTAEAVGIYLDYSKHRITDETLRLLLPLTEESGLRARIDVMFQGEKINLTEKRVVPITVLPGHSGVPCSFFSFAHRTSSG